ncbi:substrate-binding domain-containing protein [Stecheria intestinalis]|uniref:substrate-binding domain-containing protein n=1 Tax=Stecheria intestinalis TaxID=2606630 RepID=UPI0023F030AA|nr:substrate-binding domain-containing protein [Stecheria intestinalis]MCI6745055.1 substrate-binding domain-containing protein [Anaerolactibacter massiliensis]MDD5881064.1 substrate-binding domain-containing protein [Stecheria intestinalis]MDY3233071.1 substrate-binding domain-containing protein [Erysipelotrichaceae bacterium]
MNSKKIFSILTASAMSATLLAGCGGSSSSAAATSAAAASSAATAAAAEATGNAAKPLVWFNRQPSNSSTGELDMTALNWNKDTYYVGFDANQGAELQGQMVADYITSHGAELDRNGDGIIGYVLAIGDIGHNDSIARTRGVRSALGTAVDDANGVNAQPVGTNVDGSSTNVQDGSIEIDGTTYVVRELASQEMKNSAGATWDAATAGNAIGTWASSFGDQIDVVVSNNDGMGMAMFNAWSKENNVPTFGYDANSDAVAAIADGYAGTISQHADVQAYLTLRVLRNCLDGVDINTGISVADDAGNVLTEGTDYEYNADQRSFYALNLAVTADNYQDFLDATVTYKPVSNQLDAGTSPTKKVWLDIYNAADNFLSATYQPLLEKYDDLLNLDVEYIGGDGQTESNITNRLGNPDQYDAFAINMVKTDNAASYTSLLQ